jgi:hypothetical protein
MATATTPAPPTTSAPAPPTTNEETRLQYLARHTRPCLLTPKAFFVSWQGVITLAYSGFPPQLTALKSALADAHGDALPKESPGSRWPKTSLGSVRDGKRLTPEQLAALLSVCREESAALQKAIEEAAADASTAAATAATTTTTTAGSSIQISHLSVLTYECRSLERVMARERLALLGGPLDASPPSAEEAARVASVLAEADDPDYWFHASRDGGREGHYRNMAPGVTLVHELGLGGGGGGCGAGASASAPLSASSALLLAAVRRFRERIDAALPGVYAWFDEASLHVTVRAIIV